MQTPFPVQEEHQEQASGAIGQEASAQHLPVIQENATTLNDLIDISCRKYRDLPAIGMAMEEPLSYKAFHEHILALAALLRSLGIKRNDRVAILGE